MFVVYVSHGTPLPILNCSPRGHRSLEKVRIRILPVELTHLKPIVTQDSVHERWRRTYSTFRPHSSLGYRAPVLE
ncbi:MAG: integrase core domain-containing protein, partial [Planctomycetaceae bacterium]|nr:integrase core domain-containing protein [Planctomycetaceae bacterium]